MKYRFIHTPDEEYLERAKKMALLTTQKKFTVAKISKVYNLPQDVVVEYLKTIQKEGFDVAWNGLKTIPLSKTEIAKEVAALFEKEVPLKDIALKLNIPAKNTNRVTIGYLKFAESIGIKVDWSKQKKKNIHSVIRKQMAELTQQGLDLKEIAKKFGITRQAVSQKLRKAAKEGHTVVLSRLRNCDSLPNIVCREKPEKPKKVCVFCGEEFFKSAKSRSKTCSKECFAKHCSKVHCELTGGNWSRHNFFTLKCVNCKEDFQRSKSLESIVAKTRKIEGNKFCSRKCFQEHRKKNL